MPQTSDHRVFTITRTVVRSLQEKPSIEIQKPVKLKPAKSTQQWTFSSSQALCALTVLTYCTCNVNPGAVGNYSETAAKVGFQVLMSHRSLSARPGSRTPADSRRHRWMWLPWLPGPNVLCYCKGRPMETGSSMGNINPKVIHTADTSYNNCNLSPG